MPKSTAPSTGGVDQIELALCTIHEGDAPVPAFTLSDASPSGIVIPDDLSYEEWRDGLKMFKWAQNKLKLGFSAYLTFGQLKFGAAKVNQDLAQLEFEMPVVTQAIEIASVPPEIRHDNLEAEHYVVIARAGLKPPQQKKWAKTASEQNLTPVQLKASIAAGEVVSTAVARHQHHGIANILGVRAEFDAWLRRVNGEAGIRKMPAAERKMIVDELEPMAKLHAALVKEPSKKARKAKKRAKK